MVGQTTAQSLTFWLFDSLTVQTVVQIGYWTNRQTVTWNQATFLDRSQNQETALSGYCTWILRSTEIINQSQWEKSMTQQNKWSIETQIKKTMTHTLAARHMHSAGWLQIKTRLHSSFLWWRSGWTGWLQIKIRLHSSFLWARSGRTSVNWCLRCQDCRIRWLIASTCALRMSREVTTQLHNWSSFDHSQKSQSTLYDPRG
jgi:hypothetical protein